MNNYQAVYDAVRDVMREKLDISYAIEAITQDFYRSACELRRPFMALRPAMYPDGNQWCALYGENLQEGVCGFGDTPELAAIDFDNAWLAGKPPKQSEIQRPKVPGKFGEMLDSLTIRKATHD